MAIIAGGKGTRMSQLFPGKPKALIPIGGKPVLQHQLELAAAAGVTSATIFAGYLADEIAEFAGDGARFGMQISVEVERAPLGNAGGLLARLSALPDRFYILYGDVMAAIDLAGMAAFHRQRGSQFTTLAHPNDHPYDSDLLELDADDRVLRVHAPPHAEGVDFDNMVNAAAYVAERQALLTVRADGPLSFTKDVIPQLMTEGVPVFAYRSWDYIKDMGSPDRLERVECDCLAGKISTAGSSGPQPAVFLDRDGTLNEERGFIRQPGQLELLPGVGAALRRLRQAGFLLFVVTNQSVIARGDASEGDVARVHRRLHWELGKQRAYVDAVYHCPHHPDAGFPGERPELKVVCDCRKPAIGLVRRACAERNVDLTRSWLVGDQTRDIETARRAGLRSILVQTGLAGADAAFDVHADWTAPNLEAAAEIILGRG